MGGGGGGGRTVSHCIQADTPQSHYTTIIQHHTQTLIFANFRETEECLYFPMCISESFILKQQYKSQDVQVSTKTGNIYDVYFLLGLFLLLRLMLLLLSGGV